MRAVLLDLGSIHTLFSFAILICGFLACCWGYQACLVMILNWMIVLLDLLAVENLLEAFDAKKSGTRPSSFEDLISIWKGLQ